MCFKRDARASTAPDPSKQCPYESDDLEGENHQPAAFLPSWREINALSNSLGIVDGCFQPSDCTPVEKVAIIIPYKDREDHLLKWLWHMHQMLVRQRNGLFSNIRLGDLFSVK